MEYKEIISEYVDAHGEEIIKTLCEFIKIPSVADFGEKNAPFGKKCAEALNYAVNLYNTNGFDTELDSECGYALAYYGNGEKSIGIFSHADVVAPDGDWVHTSPFEPKQKDGYLIGRGVLDDKSAVIISLYCAKMLKELNIPFNSKLVMYTGSNEESGMKDIDGYLKKHKAPEFSLVSDTAFSIYRGDKSGMNFWVTFNKKLRDIENISGGSAMNITLGEATAKVGGVNFIKKGISKHSALPEGAVNALKLLAEKLLMQNNICDEDKEQLKVLKKVTEKYNGEVFGIEYSDGDFGKLTCTNGIVKTENGNIVLGMNLRYGISCDTEDIKKKIIEFFYQNNCTVRFEEEKRGYVLPEDNKYIQACLNTYKDFTGDKQACAYINAGGTYARKLCSAAEIGTTLIWGVPENTPSGHGGAHQPDECLNIKGFLEALKLTLCMIIQCDKI